MKNSTLLIEMPTNHYVTEAKANLESINGQIAYCKEALTCESLANWERKEYQATLDSLQIKLIEALKRLDASLKLA
jgi:hypothetical protein